MSETKVGGFFFVLFLKSLTTLKRFRIDEDKEREGERERNRERQREGG